ncbi:MAG: N-acetylmuramoyl-L-alanine amidase [Pseudomonadota bacterium]
MTIQLHERVYKFTTPMMRGTSVQFIQRALIAADLLPAGEDDGLFGTATRDAVSEFQRRNGLGVDGKVGQNTAAALNKLLDGTPPSEMRGSGTPSAPKKPVFTGAGPKVVSDELLPNARPKRVIIHWTAGRGRASNLDKSHYHFLVEEDGSVVQGLHRIDANDRPHPNPRASHTRRLNTHSVGVSLCGMHNAQERPFDAGRFPLREIQVQVMARLVAQICRRYDIPVTRETVLGHGEVQDILNVEQNFKWDPMVLPWKRDLTFRETGDYLRDLIRNAMEEDIAGEAAETDGTGQSDLVISGRKVSGGVIDYDTATWIALEPTCQAMGWPAPVLLGLPEDDSLEDEANGVQIVPSEAPIVLSHRMIPVDLKSEVLCVRADDFAEALELGIKVEPSGQVTLEGTIGGIEKDAVTGAVMRFVTIQRGDTLSAIARRELGDSARWRELRDEDGTHYDADSARRISAGDRVMLPDGTAAPGAETQPKSVAGLTPEIIAEAAEAVAKAADPALNRKRAKAALPGILEACYKWGVTDRSHIAYVLATAQHECNFGHPMEENWRKSAAQLAYENSNLNEKDGDGFLFRGRGYVQLTFRYNYRRYGKIVGRDLENDPDDVKDPAVAAEILVYGMSQDGFCGPNKILSAFGEGPDFDFIGARAIVNGDKNKHEKRYGTTKGRGIAERAIRFRDALDTVDLP